MDIDIINFDQDDVLDLDFDFGDSAINAANDTSRGPTAGDNCCLGFFDWGCSTYYKNVFNPGAEKNKKKSGLPNGSDRPEVYNGTESNNLVDDNFYNLPPAVELTPTPSSSQLQFAQQQQQQQVRCLIFYFAFSVCCFFVSICFVYQIAILCCNLCTEVLCKLYLP